MPDFRRVTDVRVFCVSYTFIPLENAESVQAARVLERLRLAGHEITVFTAAPDRVPALIGRSPTVTFGGGTERVRGWECSVFWRILNRVSPSLTTMPDRHIGWSLKTREAALKALMASAPDIIYSRAQPFSSHLLAAWLKRRTGLPWAAHFSDPWADSQYMPAAPWTRWANTRFEKRVVNLADIIVVTNRQTKDLFARRYGDVIDSKVRVIPHGFEPADFARCRPPPVEGFIAAHIGALYGPRSPEGLARAVALLASQGRLPAGFKLRMVGWMERRHRRTVERAAPRDVVEIVPHVSYADSLRMMCESHLLISIDAPSSGPSPFLPTKLVEYAGAGRPVLALTARDGASADFVRETEAGFVAAPDKPGEIADVLAQMLSLGDKERNEIAPRKEAVARYHAAAIALQVEATLRECLSEFGRGRYEDAGASAGQRRVDV